MTCRRRLVAMLIVLAVIVVLFGGLAWLGFRVTRPRPSAVDLRRADEAEAQPMPTVSEMQERIGEAFGQTRPPGR